MEESESYFSQSRKGKKNGKNYRAAPAKLKKYRPWNLRNKESYFPSLLECSTGRGSIVVATRCCTDVRRCPEQILKNPEFNSI